MSQGNIKGRGKTKKKGFSQTRIITKGVLVTLRARKTGEGTESLYLDFSINGKRHYDFLKKYLLLKPRTPEERKNNKETLQYAEGLRSKRELGLNTGDIDGYTPSFNKKINFIQYFEKYVENYNKKDKRLIEGSLNRFKKFYPQNYLACAELTEGLLIKFKEYLDKNLNGETPYNYFKKLKKVIAQAVKDDLIRKNPTADIKNSKTEGIKKEILSMEEIQKLAAAPCSNDVFKRGFLYSCVTGLRYSDITELKWKNINEGIMKIKQVKTGRDAIVNLNSTAMNLLGERGEAEQYIFELPTHTGCTKLLETWTKKAGIAKKITWHCARHSFATNLIIYETDVRTVSGLLGHSSIVETQKYVRLVDALMEKAVHKLPEIKI